jgi:hypothetical protein
MPKAFITGSIIGSLIYPLFPGLMPPLGEREVQGTWLQQVQSSSSGRPFIPSGAGKRYFNIKAGGYLNLKIQA